MVELNTNCEKRCFFIGLSPYEQTINREDREAALHGEEPAGSPNRMCWGCIRNRIRDAALEQETMKLLHRQ